MLARVSAHLAPDTGGSGEGDSSSQWMARFAQSSIDKHLVGASTLEAYRLDVAMLCRWAVTEKKSLLALTGADLARHLREGLEQGAQVSTLGRHLSSFRRFYSFLVEQGALVASPATDVLAPMGPRRKPRQLPDELLEKMLRPRVGRDESLGSAYRARRDHAIICTLYATGLGVSDVRLLRWPQIDAELLVINVPLRHGQGRTFVLDARTLAVFKGLRSCAATGSPQQAASSYCFPTSSGMPMSRQALCHVVRKWAADCGWDEVVTSSMIRQSGRGHREQRRHRESPQRESTRRELAQRSSSG